MGENTKKDRRGLLKWLVAGLGVAGATGLLKLRDVPKANAATGDYLKLGAMDNTASLPTKLTITVGGLILDVKGTLDVTGGIMAHSSYGKPYYALRTDGDSSFQGDIMPFDDDSRNCGTASNRWQTVHATNFYGTLASRSLSKFKENIETPSDINYLSAIPDPIYFNWKDSDDKKRHLGYVGDYLPDIAKTGEGYVYANSVLAILCGAVQQLKESVKQLKEENEQLRKKIEGD